MLINLLLWLATFHPLGFGVIIMLLCWNCGWKSNSKSCVGAKSAI